MARPPKRRGSSQRYTSREFLPYVTALGQLALAWNDLQESLAALFWTLMNPPPQAGDRINYNPLWAWVAVKSDRMQREMLREVARRSRTDWGREMATQDIKWLIKEADKLEDARNDAIHSPLFSVAHSFYGSIAGAGPIAPAWWLFNPRALKLRERSDLLGEFRYCRDAAITLSEYAQEIDGALVSRRRAWPGRPRLPNRTPKSSRQDRPRQPHPGQHPPPPPTSQA